MGMMNISKSLLLFSQFHFYACSATRMCSCHHFLCRTVFEDLSNRSVRHNDFTERAPNSPIRRSGTSFSTAPATQRSSTSFSVSLPFRTTAPRSSTSFSIANQDAVNTRSSTSLSMANQRRRKSSVSVIFQKDGERTRNRPKTVGISLLPRRKENQVRLETPDLINSKTSPINVQNSEEIDAVEECNTFAGHRENGMLQSLHGMPNKVNGTISDHLRPKTSLGHPTINVRIKTRKGQGHGQGNKLGEGRNNSSSMMVHRKSTLPAFFEDEEEKPTLLELHKERVKSANYIARIDTIVDEFKDWKMENKNMIHDYYYAGQVGTNRGESAAASAGGKGRRISMKPAETKRYTGDLQVKNLTFPTLELS